MAWIASRAQLSFVSVYTPAGNVSLALVVVLASVVFAAGLASAFASVAFSVVAGLASVALESAFAVVALVSSLVSAF